MDNIFFSPDIPFVSFSASHWWTLAVFFALLVLVVTLGRRLNHRANLWLARVIGLFYDDLPDSLLCFRFANLKHKAQSINNCVRYTCCGYAT